MYRTIIMLTVCLMSAMPAHANLRAPIILGESPSTALYKPGAPDLVVTGETLSFFCGSDQCDVNAVYTIKAKTSRDVLLSFVLPGPATVQATANNTKPQSISSVAAKDPLNKMRRASYESWLDPSHIHEAQWTASLVQGINTVAISYSQKLTREERNHSYDHEGEMVGIMKYEVWPIKEWTRSDEFAIHFSFSSTDSHVCYAYTKNGDRRDVIKLTNPLDKDGLGMLDMKLYTKETLPDQLECEIGKKKNLPGLR